MAGNVHFSSCCSPVVKRPGTSATTAILCPGVLSVCYPPKAAASAVRNGRRQATHARSLPSITRCASSSPSALMTGVSEGGAPGEAVGIAPAQSYASRGTVARSSHKRPSRKRMPFQLLLASAVSQRHLGRVVQAVKETCETHAWVRALLNVFDASQSMPLPLLPPCATIATVPGFKLLWWTRLLGPSATAGFTHVWIVDSDMDFHRRSLRWKPLCGAGSHQHVPSRTVALRARRRAVQPRRPAL